VWGGATKGTVRLTAAMFDRGDNPSFDPALYAAKLDHDLHDACKDAGGLPGLKALMQHTAAYLKPTFANGYPLILRSQQIADAVQHGPIVSRWSPSSPFLRWFRKQLLDVSFGSNVSGATVATSPATPPFAPAA
ncbi:MAG: hypothetical protein K8J31_16450, partial [Anaerolineae bacterium]|nr:hypothetical protein [Anaerolineae bacterium]